MIQRKVWCSICKKMRQHLIKLWRTEYEGKSLVVWTLQLCIDCSDKDDKLEPSAKKLGVKDWNVLVSNKY